MGYLLLAIAFILAGVALIAGMRKCMDAFTRNPGNTRFVSYFLETLTIIGFALGFIAGGILVLIGLGGVVLTLTGGV